MANLEVLQKALQITFRNPGLLEQALIHSSYVNENPSAVYGHNERLEFLGDAVLDMIVAEQLFRSLPDLPEGDLTRLRAAVVRRDTLARVARGLKLGNFLFLGKGEEAGGGRDKAANLAGALEALVAAIYLDQGIVRTRKVVLGLLRDEIQEATRRGADTDYKSRLQELVQLRHHAPPVYRLLAETGPDHEKVFTVAVTVGGREIGTGTGHSKKAAEMEAARRALEVLADDFTD